MKLKLLLSMIWVAAREPYDVTHPARVWAELLGLDDPEKKGAARINAASRRLVEGGYLTAERRSGMPSKLILRDETGRGVEYIHPGRYWDTKAASLDIPKRKDKQFYLRLPAEFWTYGWIAALSGPAVAMFLALVEQARGAKYEGIWFSQSVAARRYGLTEVTRRKGLAELEAAGLIEVSRERIGLGTFDTIRYRNTYALQMHRLEMTPMSLPIVSPSTQAARRDRADAQLEADIAALGLHEMGAQSRTGTKEPAVREPVTRENWERKLREFEATQRSSKS